MKGKNLVTTILKEGLYDYELVRVYGDEFIELVNGECYGQFPIEEYQKVEGGYLHTITYEDIYENKVRIYADGKVERYVGQYLMSIEDPEKTVYWYSKVES